MTEDDIIWENPPAARGGRVFDKSYILDAVRRQPGDYARYDISLTAKAARSRAAELRKRHPDLEFTSRQTPDGKGVIHVRKP